MWPSRLRNENPKPPPASRGRSASSPRTAAPNALALAVERHHGVAVGGGEMHPAGRASAARAASPRDAQRRWRAAGSCRRWLADRLKTPDMAVERGGLMQIPHAQLDAAQSGYSWH